MINPKTIGSPGWIITVLVCDRDRVFANDFNKHIYLAFLESLLIKFFNYHLISHDSDIEKDLKPSDRASIVSLRRTVNDY